MNKLDPDLANSVIKNTSTNAAHRPVDSLEVGDIGIDSSLVSIM
jgi:hypothetical protein